MRIKPIGTNFILLSIVLLFIFSCTLKNLETLPESAAAAPDEYIIGPEDVLQIHVWKQSDLSVTVPVRSDGKISTPLINDIQASGLTPAQLRENIAERLMKFIDEPTVSVIVTEINSLKISVSGNVNSPGIFKISDKISLVDAISLAGGVTRLAESKKIRIIRVTDNAKKIYQVN
ncbi:MAG: polysaccharide biosynthesis/export family protein, partial [Desulfobacterales bacterium]